MSQNSVYDNVENEEGYLNSPTENKNKKTTFFPNIFLFLLTFFTTTLAGVAWLNQNPYQLDNFPIGLTYAILIMSVITFHEFGHYFAAQYHKVDVTLPYYIPFPFLFLNPFGTMGAVIKMKALSQTRKALFDIAIAGPIAGWIVSLVILFVGFVTLPTIDYLYEIHPEYRTTGIPETGFSFGYNFIFWVMEKTLATSPAVFMPPMHEVYHYPFLCVGWFGLLITALNLMPVGQLDGGHISYAMLGEKHKYIAYMVFGLLIFFGLVGFLPLLGINIEIGSVNWLIWALLILFIIKIKHPPIVHDFYVPLGRTRTVLGWFSFFIFVTSFCPIPITGF